MNTRLAEQAKRFDDFAADPVTVAGQLLGQRLVRQLNGERLAGTIVEVEAYLGEKDRAAHSFGGRRTPRNESMYLPGGHAYVYLIYGIHHCLNIVCGEADEGVAVLVRAIEPTEGIGRMRANRAKRAKRQIVKTSKRQNGTRRRSSTARSLDPLIPRSLAHSDLCSGPGKLAQALAVDRKLDGADLRTSEYLWIEAARSVALPHGSILRSPRVGVDYAGAWAKRPLRFSLKANPHVSR